MLKKHIITFSFNGSHSYTELKFEMFRSAKPLVFSIIYGGNTEGQDFIRPPCLSLQSEIAYIIKSECAIFALYKIVLLDFVHRINYNFVKSQISESSTRQFLSFPNSLPDDKSRFQISKSYNYVTRAMDRLQTDNTTLCSAPSSEASKLKLNLPRFYLNPWTEGLGTLTFSFLTKNVSSFCQTRKFISWITPPLIVLLYFITLTDYYLINYISYNSS
jgi:hypothetical protein